MGNNVYLHSKTASMIQRIHNLSVCIFKEYIVTFPDVYFVALETVNKLV